MTPREDALKEHVYQKWFAQFHSGDFDVSDALRSGRLTEIDLSVVKDFVDQNPYSSLRHCRRLLQNLIYPKQA